MTPFLSITASGTKSGTWSDRDFESGIDFPKTVAFFAVKRLGQNGLAVKY
jgi:hypothetical protein